MTQEILDRANAVMELRTDRKLSIAQKGIIKRIFCKHRPFFWLWNIYGDDIHTHDGNRSAWQCSKCGEVIYRPLLMLAFEEAKLNDILKKYHPQANLKTNDDERMEDPR